MFLPPLLLQGDARRIPLPDESVDLIVTSPPYFALRHYEDGGRPVAGQLGGEQTPQEFVAALLEVTREMARVLKPGGSMFVNLGDKYAERGGPERPGSIDDDALLSRPADRPRRGRRGDIPVKSLMLIPQRYAIGCVDELDLIVRRDVIWKKASPMPESAGDRFHTSHEYWWHLTKRARYYEATARLRDPASNYSRARKPRRRTPAGQRDRMILDTVNPAGRMPGSVWEVATQPLDVPEHVAHRRCCDGKPQPGCPGVDHHAAMPFAWPRRLITAFSPEGICTACGDGRFPVVERSTVPDAQGRIGTQHGGRYAANAHRVERRMEDGLTAVRIIGEACSCTPYTDHPGTGEPSPTATVDGRQGPRPADIEARHRRVGPWREYHLDAWVPPATRPAIVLDPFSGTGTTALTAAVLGRLGVGLDLSRDYCDVADWRVNDPAERARAMDVARPEPAPADHADLLALLPEQVSR